MRIVDENRRMASDEVVEIITALSQLLFARPPSTDDLSVAEALSHNIHDLRIRFLLSDEAEARFPGLRGKIEDYFQETQSRELKRTTTLTRLGLPRLSSHLEPEPASQTALPCKPITSRHDICLAVIATRNYLPFVEVTANSFREYHKDIPIFLLLVDGTTDDRELINDCTTVLLPELDAGDVGWYAAKFDASQFANALKPAFLLYLRRYSSKAIYLDSDIAVFDRCTELIDKMGTYDLVLTPHTLAPFPRPEQFWVHPNNSDIFNSGLINAGAFGISLDNCVPFLNFWAKENFSPGAFYGPAGGQTDQQYLNWAIVLYENVCILRDHAYNVAYWNLHDRDVRVRSGDQCKMEVNGRPLVLFHFSGFDIYNPMRISKHDNRYSVYNLPSIATLLQWYRDRVFSTANVELLAAPYRFDVLPNGFRLNDFVRTLLKRFENYFPKYNSFSHVDSERLCDCLMTPLPATGSLLPLVAAVIYELRSDLQRDFPTANINTSNREFWHWFCQNAGREYNIEYLISEHRHTLVSDSLLGYAEDLEHYFTRFGRQYKFLGKDRTDASAFLRATGRPDLADSLLAGHNEWFFFSPISAILNTYRARPDLQSAFPRIFGDSQAAFSEWLHLHAAREHGIPMEIILQFDTRNAYETLGRVFNYLSRRHDLADLVRRQWLADNNQDLIRELIRGSGEGMEYDTTDVEILIYLHERERELLVPLFFELPSLRRERRSPRVPEHRTSFLPETAKDKLWAQVGCKLHESYFSLFDSLLEDEVKNVFAQGGDEPEHIFDVIRRIDVRTSASQAVSIASAAVRRRIRKYDGYASYATDLSKRAGSQKKYPGVNVFGFFYADTGVGESARGLARAIECLRDVRKLNLATGSLQRNVPLQSLFHRYDFESDTNVIVSYPHQHEDHFGTLPAEYFWGRKNIVHLAWEQKDWNPHWKAVYSRYDEIWTISHFSAIPFREMFGDRVRVVPNVLNFEDYPAFPEDAKPRGSQQKFTFLFIFDANSSMERKNPEGCIDAFIAAFRGRDEAKFVRLYLKIGNLTRPEHAMRTQRLRLKAAQSGLDIYFDGRQLHRDDVMKLIASADCYVSLHRAEGFGYTMAEAMYYGIPVIASNYSGNLEYMTPADSYLVECSETFVKEPDGPFQRGSIWGEPNLDSAADFMRHVVTNEASAREVGKRGREAVIRKLSAQAVSRLLRPALTKKGTADLEGEGLSS
jgi:glycosyltransferase involved in cell wall biosynthesis